MKFLSGLLAIVAVVAVIGCVFAAGQEQKPAKKYEVVHTVAEWRKILSPEAFEVMRHADTEAPFTGKLLNEHRKGIFVCAGCGQKLFNSDTKFDSGTGWPSFYQAISPKSVDEREDWSDGSKRIEVKCSKCGGHLGHVFDDGPQPTGLRYCMNSLALKFVVDTPPKK